MVRAGLSLKGVKGDIIAVYLDSGVMMRLHVLTKIDNRQMTA